MTSVLMIGGKALSRKLFTMTLEAGEYHVVQADSPTNGCALIRDLNPDVVLIDADGLAPGDVVRITTGGTGGEDEGRHSQVEPLRRTRFIVVNHAPEIPGDDSDGYAGFVATEPSEDAISPSGRRQHQGLLRGPGNSRVDTFLPRPLRPLHLLRAVETLVAG